MMEMGFMKNTRKVLTSLKPRVSFGITGRSDFDAYKITFYLQYQW